MQCLLCYYGDRFSHPLRSRAYSSYQLLSRLVLHQERLRAESGRRRAELLPAPDLINFNRSFQPPSIFPAAAWAPCYCSKLPPGLPLLVLQPWDGSGAAHSWWLQRAQLLGCKLKDSPTHASSPTFPSQWFMGLNLNLQQKPISGSWHYSRSILSKKNFVD